MKINFGEESRKAEKQRQKDAIEVINLMKE